MPNDQPEIPRNLKIPDDLDARLPSREHNDIRTTNGSRRNIVQFLLQEARKHEQQAKFFRVAIAHLEQE
jgi:hypothetical protein